MNKFNEMEIGDCTCYEEVLSVTLIPSSNEICFNVAKCTIGADGVEIGKSLYRVEYAMDSADLMDRVMEEYTNRDSSV